MRLCAVRHIYVLDRYHPEITATIYRVCVGFRYEESGREYIALRCSHTALDPFFYTQSYTNLEIV